ALPIWGCADRNVRTLLNQANRRKGIQMKWDRVLLATAVGAMTWSSVTRAEDVPGIRGEFIKSIDDVEQKVESLAEAMPARKFTWRPMKEVRSVSEVFM